MLPQLNIPLSQWLEEGSRLWEGRRIVYEVLNTPVNRELIVKLADKFHMRGDVFASAETYVMKEKRRSLIVYRNSGAFRYQDNDRLHNLAYEAELPSAEEAREIAIAFLEEHGWYDRGLVFDGVTIGEFEHYDARTEQRKRIVNHVCVKFRQQVDEFETFGPGAKVLVYVGHQGEIVGLFHARRRFQPLDAYPMLSGDHINDMIRHKAGVPLDQIIVREARLAYFADSPVLRQAFMQPVLVFVLESTVKGEGYNEPAYVRWETHPIPITSFAPQVFIEARDRLIEIEEGEPLALRPFVVGGRKPYEFEWEANTRGVLSKASELRTDALRSVYRGRRLTAHTISLKVTDANGLSDTHQIMVRVRPRHAVVVDPLTHSMPDIPGDPYVGVEWCNNYHGTPGLADISGTRESAEGFNSGIATQSNWSSRFVWGDDWAWEQDFKDVGAPGGGTDPDWADNVHFAYFAGHGSGGAFYFGSTVDDHQMLAQDSRWGDGILNWIVLHACNTMMNNFAWTVWCDAFEGLHQMFGFHTTTEGSTPPLGTRFAHWLTHRASSDADAMEMQDAWRTACQECYDASREYAVIYAGQAGTDTYNDHLPGFGYVSPDPTSPNYWVYYKGAC